MGSSQVSGPPPPRVRQSLRLADHDYAWPGLYFVTIVTWRRACFLSEVVGEALRLRPLGEVVATCLQDLPGHFAAVRLGDWVVMPNHVHVILEITTPSADPKAHSLATVIGAFKSSSTRHARREGYMAAGDRLWQRSFHDRVIRDANELGRIRAYVVDNPLHWSEDPENPLVTRPKRVVAWE